MGEKKKGKRISYQSMTATSANRCHISDTHKRGNCLLIAFL